MVLKSINKKKKNLISELIALLSLHMKGCPDKNARLHLKQVKS